MLKNSKSENKHIKTYLDYYKQLKSPGFAILLKGEWGCGKTYFIKKYFQLENEDYNKNESVIYISLYGINNTSSIDSLIFQKLHPFWTSKQARLVGNIGKVLLKASLKIDLNGDTKDDGTLSLSIPDLKILEEFANLEDKILIFDDLERCKIDINDLLGYINYFVEHQALKVIIIADEDKIEGDIIQSSEVKSFDKIKEKVIGKRFTISTSFDDALHVFLDSACKDDQAKKFLSEKRDFINELFEVSGSKNLRTLRSIIYDFERIYLCLPEKTLVNNDFLQDLLKSLTILSIESKSGNIPEDRIKKIVDIYKEYSSSIALKTHNEQKKTETKIIKEDFKYKQYFVFCERLNYLYMFGFEYFLPNHLWWGDFFENGIIDNQALSDSFLNSKYNTTKDSELWLKIYQFDRIESDEAFDKVINNAIEKIKNKKQFDHIGIFLHIISCLILFSEEGLISEDINIIIEIAEDYIENFSTTEEDRFFKEALEITNESSDEYFNQYKQLSFVSNDNPYFKKIKFIIAQKMRSIYNRKSLERINQVLDDDFLDHCSGMNLAQLIYRKNDTINYLLPKEVFLSNIDVGKLADYFLRINSSGQRYVLYAIFDYFDYFIDDSKDKQTVNCEALFICCLLNLLEQKSNELLQEGNRLNSYKLQKNLYEYLTVGNLNSKFKIYINHIINSYVLVVKQNQKYVIYSPDTLTKVNELIKIAFFS